MGGNNTGMVKVGHMLTDHHERERERGRESERERGREREREEIQKRHTDRMKQKTNIVIIGHIYTPITISPQCKLFIHV